MAGPPHVMHIDDLGKVVPHWLNDTKRRIHASKNAWAVDMPAFMHSTAMYGLRHGVSDRFMVSNAHAGCGSEGWGSIEGGALRRTGCAPPPSNVPLPVIHFCQFYNTEKEAKVPGRFFGKYEFSARHGGRCWP